MKPWRVPIRVEPMLTIYIKFNVIIIIQEKPHRYSQHEYAELNLLQLNNIKQNALWA